MYKYIRISGILSIHIQCTLHTSAWIKQPLAGRRWRTGRWRLEGWSWGLRTTILICESHPAMLALVHVFGAFRASHLKSGTSWKLNWQVTPQLNFINSINIYIYIYGSLSLSTYIYIYTLYIYICIYIYIYINIFI